MRHRRLRGWEILVAVMVVGLCLNPCWAQSTGTSQSAPTPPAKQEAVRTNGQIPGPDASEVPALDPDVRQWFLEHMRVQRPYDPRDVYILTGRDRQAEGWNEYQAYGMGFGPLYGGYGWSPWGRSMRSPFASSGFFLFGRGRNFFTLGNSSGFGNGGFFFGGPFFRPFGSFGGTLGRSQGRR